MTVASRGRIENRWFLTQAHLRAIVVPVIGILGALLAGRPDLLVLVAPLAMIAVWSSLARPRGAPEARFGLAREVLTEGDANLAIVDVAGLDGVELLSTSLASTPWIERRPRHGSRTALVTEDDVERGRMRMVTGADPLRWGAHAVGPMLVGAVGPWAAHSWGPVPLTERKLRVLPAPEAFDNSAPAPHPRGLVGQHTATRPGEGSEFNSVRPFQWGDRLKRINWARSTRTGELHVTSSYADQDTHIALLVDAQVDLGRSEGAGGEASSLDRAQRSAAAIAEHFTRQGDRVSLQVITGYLPQRVPPGTGKRHARRILEVLSRAKPSTEYSFDPNRVRLGLPPGTLVVVVSALVSPAMIVRAASLAKSGLTVVAIDVLGENFETPEEWDRLDHLAWRIRMMEREREILRVQQAGVGVVPWRGPGSLDVVLRLLAQRGRTGAIR